LFPIQTRDGIADAIVARRETNETQRGHSTKQLERRLVREGMKTHSGFRKAAYTALIVVLFGVSSGWLGGR